jgi:hypothetical protein
MARLAVPISVGHWRGAMKHELTIRFLVESPADPERVVQQMEMLFEHGTIRESIAEGLHLDEDPRLLDVAVQPRGAVSRRGRG